MKLFFKEIEKLLIELKLFLKKMEKRFKELWKDIIFRIAIYCTVFLFSLIIVFIFREFFYYRFYYFFDVFFYDPATVFFFFLVTTHNQIMCLLIFIFVLVSWLLFIVLKNYGWFKFLYSKSFFFGVLNTFFSDFFFVGEIRYSYFFSSFIYIFSFFVYFFNYMFFFYFSLVDFFHNDFLLNYFLKKKNGFFWRFWFFVYGDLCLNVVLLFLWLKKN
jgi:hypothetical protein